jgi:pimeloyl-ACP methyl ester carboxylesterase
VPTLVLVGRDDKLTPPVKPEGLASHIPPAVWSLNRVGVASAPGTAMLPSSPSR